MMFDDMGDLLKIIDHGCNHGDEVCLIIIRVYLVLMG